MAIARLNICRDRTKTFRTCGRAGGMCWVILGMDGGVLGSEGVNFVGGTLGQGGLNMVYPIGFVFVRTCERKHSTLIIIYFWLCFRS